MLNEPALQGLIEESQDLHRDAMQEVKPALAGLTELHHDAPSEPLDTATVARINGERRSFSNRTAAALAGAGLLSTGIGASLVGLLAYVFAERFASDPILPLDLFQNRTFTTANLAGFLVSMSFMSTVAFLPLFMQLGQGVAATTSGLSTLPLMAGIMGSSIVCGRLVTRTG